MARYYNLAGVLALTTILAAGALVLWGLTAIHIISVIEACRPRGHSEFREFFVQGDGTPVFECSADEDGPVRKTVDGKPLPPANGRTDRLLPSLLKGPAQHDEKHEPSRWSNHFVQLRDHGLMNRTEGAKWYFVSDGMAHGHGYFANCSMAPGYIGQDGFQLDKPQPERQFAIAQDGQSSLLTQSYISTSETKFLFEPTETMQFLTDGADLSHGSALVDLVTEDGLLQIDLDKQSVKVLRQEKAVSALVWFKRAVAVGPGHSQPSPEDMVVLFRTSDRVRVLSFNGEEQGECLLPKELRNCDLEWYWLPDGNVLARVYHEAPSSGNRSGGWELVWFTKTGEILRNWREKTTEKDPVFTFTNREIIEMSFAVPSPATIAGFVAANPGVFVGHQELNYWTALGEACYSAWLAILLTCTASAPCAWLCYRRQRKYGQPNAWGWAAFVLLLGVPGYLGYLAHRAWPTRLPCPHCGKPAPRDRPACFTCGRDFPPPAPKGIEVFA